MRFLIIGGSDAGISAALRAQELDHNAEITVLLEDEFPNFSICGLPFFLSGETPDWRKLAHRTQFEGISIRPKHRAVRIDPRARNVEVRAGEKELVTLSYDKLLVATGASPVRPPINGVDLPGVFFLHTMADSFALQRHLESANSQRAVIVGAGYIGLEMADALRRRGIQTSLVSRPQSVLPTVDGEFGDRVAHELRQHEVSLHPGVEVHTVAQIRNHLHLSGSNGFEQDCELVLIAAGVRPNTQLGRAAGLEVSTSGAFTTNRRMQSNIADTYVAGDCAQTWHRVLQRYAYLPLGTTSHKQGRIAGSNVMGVEREFAGTTGTQVVKVFELIVARTGLRDQDAALEGYRPLTVESEMNDHKDYYPGATRLHARVTGDEITGKLLGAQLVGAQGSQVAKRIDVFAAALFHDMAIDEICDLDLSYTPPVSSPWDPVQMAGQAWTTKWRMI